MRAIMEYECLEGDYIPPRDKSGMYGGNSYITYLESLLQAVVISEDYEIDP